MIIFTIKESENKELESSSIIHLYCEIIIKPKKKKVGIFFYHLT